MRLRTTHILGLALVALLALGAPFSLAEKARAAQPGVVSDLTWYISDSDKQRTVQAMEDLGSNMTRLAIQWREAEPERDRYNEWWLEEYGKAIDMARAGGQRVIVMVDSAPAWASGSSSSNVPRDPADFASFMSTIAKRYAGRVDAWEVWNEENTTRFWSTGPSPSAYTALLRAAYPAIKAADPNAKVVFGGTAGNDYSFLAGAYAAGAKGYFDVLATHPYPYCGSSSPADVRMNGNRISKDSFLGYREMHRTMVENGDPKPIWVTEIGWNTSSTTCDPGSGVWQGGVSETTQADFLYEAYKLLEQDSYVEYALWYDIRNNYWMHDEDQPEAQFGLMKTDFTPKPAYAAFKAYAHGLPYATSQPPVTKPPKKKKKSSTSTSLRIATEEQAVAPAQAVGRVANADEGVVTVVVQVRAGGHWRTVRRRRARVDARGRYRTGLSQLPPRRVRARAVFGGSSESRPSRSRFVQPDRSPVQLSVSAAVKASQG
jgi:hypothetical protein